MRGCNFFILTRHLIVAVICVQFIHLFQFMWWCSDSNNMFIKNFDKTKFKHVLYCVASFSLFGLPIWLNTYNRLTTVTALITSTIFAVSTYFSKIPQVAIASSSLFIAGGSVSNNVMVSVAVDLFPTTLR